MIETLVYCIIVYHRVQTHSCRTIFVTVLINTRLRKHTDSTSKTTQTQWNMLWKTYTLHSRDERTVISCDPDPVLIFQNSVQVQPKSNQRGCTLMINLLGQTTLPTLRKLFRAVLEFSIELDTILTTPISWACFFVATNILDVSQFVKMLWFMSLYYEILIVVLSLYFLCCYFSLSTFHL